jgi:hypothetical protein
MARVAPIYGKLNLAGELPVHFQAFLTFGAGAALLRHESVNLWTTTRAWITSPSASICSAATPRRGAPTAAPSRWFRSP